MDVDIDVDEWTTIAERIRDQLAAARIVLRLRLDPEQPMRTVVVSDELATGYETELGSGDPLLHLPGSHVRHLRITEANPQIRAALLRRGASEALVVPLPVAATRSLADYAPEGLA